MKLTKLQALRMCVRLWKWLEKNPSKLKSNWIEWEINGGNIKKMPSNCPCCSYTMNTHGFNCKKCPLVKLWGVPIKTIDMESTPCAEGINSPYNQWGVWEDANKSENARKIWKGAEKEINKLRRKK